MDGSVLLVFGGFMILVGFLSSIRYRFATARRRLTPAASIRSRGGSGGYSASSGSSMGKPVSLLLMLAGGIVVIAGVLAA